MEPNLNKTWKKCIVCGKDFPAIRAITCYNCQMNTRSKQGGIKYKNALKEYKKNCSL
jgi:hypothetical protein